MALIECEKCGEQVDDAKAFCPACGNSLIEERRRTLSTNFEQMDMTVQLGNTMFNQMLNEMGLKSGKPDGHDLPAEPPKMAPLPTTTVVPPAAAAPRSKLEAPVDIVPPKASNRKVWVITIVVALVLLFVLLAAAGLAGGIFYYYTGSQ